MIKAIFIDYTGTTVMPVGEELYEFARLVVDNSKYNDINTFLKYWYTLWKDIEAKCYNSKYMTFDEIFDICLNTLIKDYELNCDLEILKKLVYKFWSNAPIYDDALEFYKKCKLPIYVITNNTAKSVEDTLNKKNIFCAGVISSDEISVYKPDIRLFKHALNKLGLNANEILHIGDSLDADYYAASSVGINACLIVRKDNSNITDDIKAINKLTDILDIIEKI